MDLVKHVYDTLILLKMPVVHLTRPEGLPGLSYHFFGSRPSLHGDGIPKREECQCQVDVWTSNGYDYPINKKVKRAMRQAGFARVSEDEDHERDTGLYHKILVFHIEYGTEDDDA